MVVDRYIETSIPVSDINQKDIDYIVNSYREAGLPCQKEVENTFSIDNLKQSLLVEDSEYEFTPEPAYASNVIVFQKFEEDYIRLVVSPGDAEPSKVADAVNHVRSEMEFYYALR